MMGFIDESYKISNKLPQDVRDGMAALEKAYKEDDLIGVATWEDYVDVELRAYCLCGVITEDECEDMMRRYGWYR